MYSNTVLFYIWGIYDCRSLFTQLSRLQPLQWNTSGPLAMGYKEIKSKELRSHVFWMYSVVSHQFMYAYSHSFLSCFFILMFSQDPGTQRLQKPATYVNYHPLGSQKYCFELKHDSAYPSVTLLPQNRYTQQSTHTPMHTLQSNIAFPAQCGTLSFPKEHSV